MSSLFERLESKVRSYSLAFPTTFNRAIGAELFDVSGNRYIDFLAGCGALNYGHNNPILKGPLLEYLADDGVVLGLDMQSAAKERLLQAIDDVLLKPRQLNYKVQFTGPTGANAVEAALKLARKVKGRSNILSFTNGYHGVTLGALAATGNKGQRSGAAVPLSDVTTVPYEGYPGIYRDTTQYIDQLLSDPSSGVDLPAACIVECVQGEGGLNAASESWLRQLEALCRRHDILLIVDDIQAGCGRTGSFFSFEASGIKPDIVTLSKSLSGYGLPMSVVLLKPEHDIWSPAEHNGTFRGNNAAFVTATTALTHYWSDDSFSDIINAKSRRVRKKLEDIRAHHADDIVQVRGRGMMLGLECADPELAKVACAIAFKNGLIIERAGPSDEVIKFLAPLTIDESLIDEGLQILSHSVTQAIEQRGTTRQVSVVGQVAEAAF